MCWVPTMFHALKAEGTTVKKPLQLNGWSLSPSLSQPSTMLLAYLCRAILIWTRYFPHIIYFCIFLKSLSCNTNRAASQGCQGKGSAGCSPQARFWRREGTKLYHPPHSWLIQCSHLSCTFKDLMKGWLDQWMPCLLTLLLSYQPQAGDTVLSSPQMQPKRPIPKNPLSCSFILWRRGHMAVSTASVSMLTKCQSWRSVRYR